MTPISAPLVSIYLGEMAKDEEKLIALPDPMVLANEKDNKRKFDKVHEDDASISDSLEYFPRLKKKAKITNKVQTIAKNDHLKKTIVHPFISSHQFSLLNGQADQKDSVKGLQQPTEKNPPLNERNVANKKLHEKGKLTRANGDVYEGNFVNGNPHGKGKLTQANGNVYEGDFLKGKPHGQNQFKQ